MDVKGEVLLQLLNKSKLRNGIKTFREPNFSLFIVKFKKLEFSAPLIWLVINPYLKRANARRNRL